MKLAFKFLLFSLIITTFGCSNNAQKSESESAEVLSEKGIKFFKGSFKEAQTKAKAEGKLIFMDAYTSWCGPCKMMQKNTFPDDVVGKLFNEKFVSVAFDMEVGEGLELSAKYPVQGFPTLFFLDAEGKLISAELGYRDPAGLIALGNEITKKVM
jgi:thioredoxin 1